VLLQLGLEFFAALKEFSFLALVLLLDCSQLCLQLLLVHCEALNLPPQHLHSCCRDNAAHIRDHCFAKDIVNQTVVPHEPGMSDMLHTEPIVRIFLVLRRLDVNSTLGILTTPTVVRLFRYVFEYSDTFLNIQI
jgi:hypothetical protein